MENFKCIIVGDFSWIVSADKNEYIKNMENSFILREKLVMSEIISFISGKLVFEWWKVWKLMNTKKLN